MIEVQGLTKRFGKLTAVNEVSFTVERGDAFGIIGPNGAGKTTTMRMLATTLKPDSGTVTINGHDIAQDPTAVRACVGYMPDFFGVYDDMKVWEYLDFFGAAYRVPWQKRPGLIGDVLELTDLSDKRDEYVDALSRGMKQRLCLAKTLIHDPDVLLLDEPASGLDPRARIEIRQLLQQLCKMDKTVFISSHILRELADLCNKIGIIEQGRLLLSDSMANIMRKVAGRPRILVAVEGDRDKARAVLQTHPEIAEVTAEGNRLAVCVRSDDAGPALICRLLVDSGFGLCYLKEEELRLEDAFMRLTKGLVS